MPEEARQKNKRIFARAEDDWYVEPERVTRQLLSRERFAGTTWDPACGQGNVLLTMLHARVDAVGSDIVNRLPTNFRDDYPRRFRSGDFFDPHEEWPWSAINIVTNPPYGRAAKAEAFIRRALDLVPGKVAVFVEMRFLGAHKRASGLFAERPPSRLYFVLPRPSCPPGAYIAAGGKVGGGEADYVWIVWDNAAPASGTQAFWLTADDA